MNKLVKVFAFVAALFIPSVAFATMGADLAFKDGATEQVALADFEKAVALSGGRINVNTRGEVSVEGEFPSLKTRASALVQTMGGKKVITLRVSSVVDLIEKLTGLKEKKETEVILKIVAQLESMGYKNLPPPGQ